AVNLKDELLQLRIRLLGKEHTDTLRAMANLASTYRDQGRWDDAVKLEEEVLNASIRLLGKEHPDTLTAMANLALTYWNQGRWDDAVKLEEELLMKMRMANQGISQLSNILDDLIRLLENFHG